MVCKKCGAQVPEGWTACRECGTPVAGPAVGAAQDMEASVFPLLAAANLSRIGGRHAEAERQCLDLLARYPYTPAAYSLLGEVYEDQGRYDDAVSQYQLALELDPASETERQFLRRAMQREAIANHRVETNPVLRTGGPRPFEFSSRFLPWVTIILLAILCLGLFAYVLSRMLSHGKGAGDPATSAARQAPVIQTPTEASIRTQLEDHNHSSVPNYVVGGIVLDPRYQMVRITAEIRDPLTPANARSSIAAVAADLALAAVPIVSPVMGPGNPGSVPGPGAATGMIWISLRILGTLQGKSAPALLFTGEISSTGLTDLDPTHLAPDTFSARFQNPWWSPDLSG